LHKSPQLLFNVAAKPSRKSWYHDSYRKGVCGYLILLWTRRSV